MYKTLHKHANWARKLAFTPKIITRLKGLNETPPLICNLPLALYLR